MVEEFLRKQEDFEKMLAAQEEKFVQLNRETKVEERDRKRREVEEKRQKELNEQRRLKELVRQSQRICRELEEHIFASL